MARGGVLIATLVLAVASAATAAEAAHVRWIDDVVVTLDAAGRPILPDRAAARRGVRVPSPRAVNDNELRFTFESREAPWTPAERATLATVLGDCYPVVREVYGAPAFDNTVNVRRDPDLSFEGAYDPTHDEILLRVAATPDVICHELMHAFRDDHIISLSSFEEGMARAAEIEVFDRLEAYEHSFDERHSYGYDVYYEGLDRPAIGGRGGGFFLGYVSPLVRYQLAGYAWGKVQIEHSDFFSAFNQDLYATSLAGDADATEAQLVALVAARVATVEGEPFTAWYERQGVFDTNPPTGYVLYQRINQLTVDFFHRDADGIEVMQADAPFTWRVYDDADALLDQGEGTTNAFGVGFLDDLALPPEYSGRIRVVVSALSPDGPIEDVAFRPVGTERGVFGVVLGASAGTVTVQPLDDATPAVGARVEHGAFSAPLLAGVRGRFEAVFEQDGRVARRRFTKDASDYFLPISVPEPPSCAAAIDGKAVVKTRARGARLEAKFVIAGSYDGEPIALALQDGNGASLTAVELGALTPVGRGVRRWRRSGGRNDVVRRVVVRPLRSRPGTFEVEVTARGAFAATADGQPNAVLTVTIGGRCTRQAVGRRSRRSGSRSPT